MKKKKNFLDKKKKILDTKKKKDKMENIQENPVNQWHCEVENFWKIDRKNTVNKLSYFLTLIFNSCKKLIPIILA